MDTAERNEEVRKQIRQLREMANKHLSQAENARSEANKTVDEVARISWDQMADREMGVVETLERQIEQLEHALAQL